MSLVFSPCPWVCGTGKPRRLCYCAFAPVIRRASSARTLHAPGMDELTGDELLADAIGYVALNVLDRLAGDADARRAFLECFVRLATTHGGATEWPCLAGEPVPAPTQCLHGFQI